VAGRQVEFTSITRPGRATDEALVDVDIPGRPRVAPSASDPAAFVGRQYLDLLGRAAEPEESQGWSDRLREGATPAQVVEGILCSEECVAVRAHVLQLYLACCLGIPDFAALQGWTWLFRQGYGLAAIARALTDRGEFRIRYSGLSEEDFVDKAFNDVFCRPRLAPDYRWQGQARWQTMLDLATSPEFAARAFSRVFVTMAYTTLLKRVPDAAGYAYWVDRVDGGGGRVGLLTALLDSPEYASRFA
jgi:Domain of unknown function (DUF4214)